MNVEGDIFLPFLESLSRSWSLEVFSDFLKALPDTAVVQPKPVSLLEPETTPSYVYLTEQRQSKADHRGFLNTTHSIVGSEASAMRRKSPQEHVLEEWEDDMVQRDILRGRLRYTAEKAEQWLQQKPEERTEIEKLFGVLDRKTVERVYGGSGEALLEAMQSFPEKVLPLISKLLTTKEEELNHYCILSRSRMGPDGPFFV